MRKIFFLMIISFVSLFQVQAQVMLNADLGATLEVENFWVKIEPSIKVYRNDEGMHLYLITFSNTQQRSFIPGDVLVEYEVEHFGKEYQVGVIRSKGTHICKVTWELEKDFEKDSYQYITNRCNCPLEEAHYKETFATVGVSFSDGKEKYFSVTVKKLVAIRELSKEEEKEVRKNKMF